MASPPNPPPRKPQEPGVPGARLPRPAVEDGPVLPPRIVERTALPPDPPSSPDVVTPQFPVPHIETASIYAAKSNGRAKEIVAWSTLVAAVGGAIVAVGNSFGAARSAQIDELNRQVRELNESCVSRLEAVEVEQEIQGDSIDYLAEVITHVNGGKPHRTWPEYGLTLLPRANDPAGITALVRVQEEFPGAKRLRKNQRR